jgi:Cys-rich repeat protein
MCDSGNTNVCDLATMACVECVTSAECGTGGLCQADHTCN